MFMHESGPADGPTSVFLHGNGTNGTMWKAHMKQLSAYHCLAPDFPGFGQSCREEWISLEETADRVLDLIHRHTKYPRAHIVGLSLGGSTAITLLGKAPEVVDHAIVDGAGVLPLPGLPLMKVGFHVLQPFLHTNLVTRTLARSMKVPDNGYDEFRQGMLGPLAVVGAAISLFMLLVYLHPFYALGIGADVVLLVALLWLHWPRPEVIGV